MWWIFPRSLTPIDSRLEASFVWHKSFGNSKRGLAHDHAIVFHHGGGHTPSFVVAGNVTLARTCDLVDLICDLNSWLFIFKVIIFKVAASKDLPIPTVLYGRLVPRSLLRRVA